MCEFTSDFDRKKMGYSPDRVDALVWGLTQVLVTSAPGSGIMEYYRQELEAKEAGVKREPGETLQSAIARHGGAEAKAADPATRSWADKMKEANALIPGSVVPTGTRAKGSIARAPLALMVPPPSVNTAYGITGKRYDLRPDGLMEVDEDDANRLIGAGFRRKAVETTE